MFYWPGNPSGCTAAPGTRVRRFRSPPIAHLNPVGQTYPALQSTGQASVAEGAGRARLGWGAS